MTLRKLNGKFMPLRPSGQRGAAQSHARYCEECGNSFLWLRDCGPLTSIPHGSGAFCGMPDSAQLAYKGTVAGRLACNSRGKENREHSILQMKRRFIKFRILISFNCLDVMRGLVESPGDPLLLAQGEKTATFLLPPRSR